MHLTEPDPLPISRRYAHLLVGLIFTGVFVEIAMFSSGPWVGTKNEPGRLDWMSEWGWTLRDATPDTLLAYVAVALVFYGISLGGQSAFTTATDRTRVRRTVGAMGAALAMSAMALCVFAIAGSTAHRSLVPLLVVVIPTTLATWALGIEVSRFVVPAHGKQLENAHAQLQSLQERIARLIDLAPASKQRAAPGRLPIPPLRTAFTSLLARAVFVGAVTGVVASAGDFSDFVPGFLTAATLTGLGLLMFVGMTSGNLVADRSRTRSLVAGLAVTLYVLLALLGAVNLVVIVGDVSAASLVVIVLPLMLLPGFSAALAPKRASLARWNWSLRGALVSFEGSSLRQNEKQTAERIVTLEQMQGSASRSLSHRFHDAVRAFRS